MADGALARFEADTAIAITGIAGPGRRHGGEAGRLRVLVREARRRRGAGPGHRACPGDRAEIRDRSTTVGDAPAAAAAAWRRAPGLSRATPRLARGRACSWRSTCRSAAREALAAWRDELDRGARDLRPVPRGGAPRDARLPRLAGREGRGADRGGRVRGRRAARPRRCWRPRGGQAGAADAARACSPSTSRTQASGACGLQAAVSEALEAGALLQAGEAPVLAAHHARAGQARRPRRAAARGRAAGASRSEAAELTLYRSTLRPQGALYEPLARRGLAYG